MEFIAFVVALFTPIQSWFMAHPPAGLLLLLITLDVITGVLRAFRDRAVASDVSSAGITRKAAILIAVLLGYVLAPFAPGLPVGDALAFFYCASEGMSLLENLALLGAPVPSWMQAYFSKLAENAPDKNIARPAFPSLMTRPSASVEQPAEVAAPVEETTSNG